MACGRQTSFYAAPRQRGSMLKPTCPLSAPRAFLISEASGGILLMAAAALGMAVANSAVALGFDTRPEDVTWLQVYGLSLLCRIGFTMSLFIGGLAFTDPVFISEGKIGMLSGSVAAAIVEYLIFRYAPASRQKPMTSI